jgi:hypothetical protein
VTWAFAPLGEPDGVPLGFYVYLTEGSSSVDSTPAATVPFVPGTVGYSCTLAGPYSPSTYSVSVRAFNKTGIETNTKAATGTIGFPTAPFVMEPLQVTQLNTTAV